jgi:hypothetical protein
LAPQEKEADAKSFCLRPPNHRKSHTKESNEGFYRAVVRALRAKRQEESAYEVLNLNIDEKGPAYTWLDQGAEELLDYW